MAWSWFVQGVFGSSRFPNQPVSFVQPEQWPQQVFRRSSLIDNVVQHFLSQLTAGTTNTRPQRVFSSGQICVLVDVNQPLP